jgi:hypothetical protein
MPEYTEVPNGKGGWEKVALRGAKTKVKADDASVQKRMQEAQEKDFFDRVGACTESLNRFLEIYMRDHELSVEEVLAAVYLECLNNWEFYPGGKEQVAKIHKDVHDYFEANKSAVAAKEIK